MKVLVISPKIPEPGKKGYQALSYFRLTHLSLNHQVSLICFGSSDVDINAKNNLEAAGISVRLVSKNIFTTFLHLISSLYRFEIPYQCLLFNSRDFKREVNSYIASHNPDLIYSITFRVLDNLHDYKKPLFVDLIDSMALNFSRRVLRARNISKLLLLLEFRRVVRYERKVAEFANQCCVVSSIDKTFINSESVAVMPLGIDVDTFYRNPSYLNVPTIIFTGNMNYRPNVEAVLWFCENCWGDLKVAIPNIRFVIAGASPSNEIMDLTNDGSIVVTGRVSSIADWLNCAHVSIAPMQSGSGMQFKILEAMACGIPVVTTSLGLSDIKAIVSKEILVADSSDLFVSAIKELLNSPDYRNLVGQSGLDYVVANHSWDVLNSKFEQLLIKTAQDC